MLGSEVDRHFGRGDRSDDALDDIAVADRLDGVLEELFKALLSLGHRFRSSLANRLCSGFCRRDLVCGLRDDLFGSFGHGLRHLVHLFHLIHLLFYLLKDPRGH